MSIAEMLEEAGQKKGIILTAKNMLAEKIPLDTVKKVTKLSDDILNSLMPQNPSSSS